jgi:hypothetical protein
MHCILAAVQKICKMVLAGRQAGPVSMAINGIELSELSIGKDYISGWGSAGWSQVILELISFSIY